MKKVLRFLIICLISIVATEIQAAPAYIENIRFNHITVNEGLAHNVVNDIVRDNNEFVWIATRGGLCRYDGNEVKTYLLNKRDSTSIPHNFVTALLSDSYGRLWVATEGGLCRYNPARDNFKVYNFGTEAAHSSAIVVQLDDGKVIASSDNLLYLYNDELDEFEKLYSNLTYPNHFVCAVEGDPGMLWIGTIGGLKVLDIETREEVPLSSFANKFVKPLEQTHILSLHKGSNGEIYVGTHEYGLFIYDQMAKEFLNLSMNDGLSSNVIRAIMDGGDNLLWVGGELGIDIIDLSNGEIYKITHNQEDRKNLNDNAIYALYRDSEGNFWVGTYFGGVNVCYADYVNFTYYPFGYSRHHLSGKAVRQIISNDDESLWIATEDGGVNLFDKKKKTFDSESLKISYHNAHTLLKDSHNNLWIGTFTGGLNRYNLRTGVMECFNYDNTGMSINNVFSMVEDRSGKVIWIGSSNGLYKYDSETGEFSMVVHPVLANKHVYYLIQDFYGTLWIASRRQGIITYNPSNNKAYSHTLGNGFDSFNTSIFEDSNYNIWIASNDAGVMLIDRMSDTRTVYTIDNGLPTNSVMSIIEDKKENVWLSTTGGLCRLEPVTQSVKNYTIETGLPTNQFNYSSSYMSSDGELFFGTNNGMIAFYPEKLRDYAKPPSVILMNLMVNGESVEVGESVGGHVVLKKHLMEAENITLSHNQAKLFSINFTSINFNGGKVRYFMAIDNSDWQHLGDQRRVTFSHLSSGLHKVKFGAMMDESGSGPGIEKVTSIDINVLPSFWMSPYAFIIYLLVVLAIIWIAFRLLSIRLKYENKIKLERMEKDSVKELNKQKISFFTNISHELKTPLTLILSPLDMILKENKIPEKQKRQLEVVSRNADRMLSMIDEQLTFSKIEMGQAEMCVQYGAPLPFIERMCQIFKIVASTKGITMTTEINDADKTKVWFSPQTVEKIIYNLTSNSLKFTRPKGTITIGASLEHDSESNDILKIEVIDTGIGISEKAINNIFDNYYQINPSDKNRGTGIGLAFTKALVNQHRGEISVSSEVNIGTAFTVQLNVSESAYSDKERSALELKEDYASSYSYTSWAVEDELEPYNEVVNASHKGTKHKLLIVEDNKGLNEFISELFSDQYEVISALDGEDGLDLVMRCNPDLVISDVMMPKMNGFELTKQIKSGLSTCHIPVMLLTAKTEQSDAIEGFGYGADAYVKKPFNAETLVLQVKNLLRTRDNNINKFKGAGIGEIDVSEITYNRRDEEFMRDVIEFVKDNVSNESLVVEDITDHMGVSRSLLYLKLKELADLSATELIRKIRLAEAQKKLREGYNVSEVSYAVGISDPNYFTKFFKREYGITPTEYVKMITPPIK